VKVHSLLERLSRQGATVELDKNDRLKINAPEGVLTDEFFQELQDVREEIRELLQHQNAGNSDSTLRVADRQGPLPLSHAQARLWFQQKALGGASYNNTTAIRLRGAMHEDAFKRAINAIIARHEVLRTTFQESRTGLCQVIAPRLVLVIPTEDIRGYDRRSQDEYVEGAIKEEQNRPFDLITGPLLRVKLYRLNEEEYIVVRTQHHIVSDGWSEAIFNTELRELYFSFSNGGEDPLPPLPMQYADFAIWQQTHSKSGILDEGVAYWRHQLSGIPAQLELPIDHLKPARRTFIAGTKTVRLSSAETAALKRLSRQHQATVYSCHVQHSPGSI
jgi:hypothetical protein